MKKKWGILRMNGALAALIVVLVAVVLVPIIFKIIINAYQDLDFQRQIEGRVPERKYKGANPPVDISEVNGTDGITSQQAYKETCDTELRMRGMQNIIGPK